MKKNKAERNKERWHLRQKEKYNTALFKTLGIIFLIAIVGFNMFKPYYKIGHDIRYDIVVWYLPAALGAIAAIIYMYKYADFSKLEKGWQKILFTVLALYAGIVLSLTTLGMSCDLCFEVLNYEVAKMSIPETKTLKVTEFHEKKSSRGSAAVRFMLNGEEEEVKTRNSYIQDYRNQHPLKKHIRLYLRKGLWNHYIVDDWEVVF